MEIKKLMQEMIDRNASDLFYRAGGIVRLRVDGKVIPLGKEVLSVEDVMLAAEQLTNAKQRETFKNNLDVDFAVY